MRVIRAQPIEDVHKDGLALAECFSIRVAQYMEAAPIQICRSPCICRHRLGIEMLTAVEFDDVPGLDAAEVGEVAFNGALAAELVAFELAIT